jgi:hypothetical protein
MAGVTATTEIDRCAEDVFAYATDPTRFHEWQAGVVEGHLDHPDAPQVGTLCHTTRRIGFADRSSTSALTHIDPPRTWGVRGLDGPIRAIVDLAVTALGPTRARLSITVDFEGHGIGKLLVPMAVRPAARKEMPANLAALKQRIERT